MNVDGAPGFGFAGARGRAAMIGRGAARVALEQHWLIRENLLAE
jgi:hypothetical protein